MLGLYDSPQQCWLYFGTARHFHYRWDYMLRSSSQLDTFIHPVRTTSNSQTWPQDFTKEFTHTHCVSALWAMTDLMLPNTHCDVCQTLVSFHTCSSYILFNCNNKHVTYVEFILASKQNSTPFLFYFITFNLFYFFIYIIFCFISIFILFLC